MIDRQTIVISAAKGRYTSKPRPWVVLQNSDFDAIGSIVLCGFTRSLTAGVPLLRIDVMPSVANGLRVQSQIQVEKIVAVHRQDIDREIGRLEDRYMEELENAVRRLLGL